MIGSPFITRWKQAFYEKELKDLNWVTRGEKAEVLQDGSRQEKSQNMVCSSL
jgi:hypothetical protein